VGLFCVSSVNVQMCYIVTMDKDASLRDLMEILAGADEWV
jgi:hypothetical protein